MERKMLLGIKHRAEAARGFSARCGSDIDRQRAENPWT
jgi:hypothetical protein